MDFKCDLFGELLRIVTPATIAELSTDSGGRQKVSLSKIVEVYSEDGEYETIMLSDDDQEERAEANKAKILSFSKPSSDSEATSEVVESKKVTYQCGPRTFELLKDFIKLCEKMEGNLLGPKRIPKRKMGSSQASGSDYLLEQKKQFERSYNLLKSQEVLSLYKKSSKSVIIKKTKVSADENEEFQEDHDRGVLINKKQA